jgi:hypothetical protein
MAAGFRYSYDFNNDGTFELTDVTNASVSYTFTDNGLHIVRGRIKDKDGGFADYTTAVEVNNVAPTASLAASGAVSEGSAGGMSFSGQFDPSTADIAAGFVYSYDFNNDGTFEITDSPSSIASVPASFLDDGPGARTVRGRIKDKDGGFTDYTTTISVTNVAPTVSAGGPYVGNIGALIAFVGLVTDPSVADSTAGFSFLWNFGDGSTSTSLTPSHSYAAAGTYNVSLSATDKDGATTTATTTALVNVPVAGTSYYVSPTGSDSNSGTFSTPFRTLAKGTSVLKPGDTLYVRAGTYAESLSDKIPSGTSWTAPVTVAAYPGEQVVVQPTSGNFVMRIQGSRSYIIVDGLIFDGSFVASANVYIVAISSGTPQHIRIKNSEIRNGPSQGILVESIAGYPKPEYNEFLNLRVHDNGTTDFAHGFYIQSNHNLIESCEIYRNAGWGIQVYKEGGINGEDAGDNIIRNNKVHDNARAGARGVGIGLYVGKGNIAYNNLVWNNNNGIVIGIGATETKVFNNTVYQNSGTAGIYVKSDSTNAIVKNNIAYLNAGSNIRNDGAGTALDANLAGIDPKFVDAANYDFHLLAGSPAIDQGSLLSEVEKDFDGVARPQGGSYDIGAFEYH